MLPRASGLYRLGKATLTAFRDVEMVTATRHRLMLLAVAAKSCCGRFWVFCGGKLAKTQKPVSNLYGYAESLVVD